VGAAEQRKGAPDGAAARLLEIFERHPQIAEELMQPRVVSPKL